MLTLIFPKMPFIVGKIKKSKTMKQLKTILYIATSQDGFIADKDGGVGWLDPYNNIEGEDCGYHGFYESIDGIIMGSRSYEQIVGFGEWIWPGKPAYVFT